MSREELARAVRSKQQDNGDIFMKGVYQIALEKVCNLYTVYCEKLKSRPRNSTPDHKKFMTNLIPLLFEESTTESAVNY